MPDEIQPRIYSTLREASREARATHPEGGRIRIGLTGLSTDPRSATAAMFAPCPNITFAARQITRFAEPCKTKSRVPVDPVYCGVAAYRGSWKRPDTKFADTVRAAVEKGTAPNLDMPKDAYFDSTDIVFEASTRGSNVGSTAPAHTSDDRERGWSSALFPTKAAMQNGAPADVSTRGGPTAESRSTDRGSAHAIATKAPGDSLFVPRSTERRL